MERTAAKLRLVVEGGGTWMRRRPEGVLAARRDDIVPLACSVRKRRCEKQKKGLTRKQQQQQFSLDAVPPRHKVNPILALIEAHLLIEDGRILIGRSGVEALGEMERGR